MTFQGLRRRLYDAIVKRPDGLTKAQLMHAVYWDHADGGPLSDNIISVMINEMNKTMSRFGLKIVSTGGPGALYVLVECGRNVRTGRKQSRTAASLRYCF